MEAKQKQNDHSVFQKLKSSGKLNGLNLAIWLVLIIIAVVLSITVKGFFSLNNITNILAQSTSSALLAMGVTFVLISGGMDLSAPVNMMASGIVGTMVMRDTGNIFLGILVIFAMSVLIGVLNGIVVAKIRIVPFIATMAMMTVVEAVGQLSNRSQSITGLPSAYSEIFNARIGGVFSVQIIFLLVIGVIMHIVLSKTIFGRWLYAVGKNEKSALICGVPTNKVLIITYAISGVMAAISSVMTTARLNAASVSMGGESTLMDVIAGSIIGGASLNGGKGTIYGAVLGIVFITIIGNIMNLAGVTYYVTLIIKGTIIVVFTYIDLLRDKRR